MVTSATGLIEIGTEELPALAINAWMTVFAQQIAQQLQQRGFEFSGIETFSTPRRLGLMIPQLTAQTAAQEIERKGPSLKAAFDEKGEPTKACVGFAASCGCEVSDLEKVATDKGDWLVYRSVESGKTIQQVLPEIVQQVLMALPMAKRMRWGASSIEFARPIHWIVLMYGSDVIPGHVFGLPCDRKTYGHRFHHPQSISLQQAQDYPTALRQAKVLADEKERRELIWQQVTALAQQHQAVVTPDEALLQEVTALVEWPVALLGTFEKEFLHVPAEALVTAMKTHQRYFHLTNAKGELLPYFITISNIESVQPQQVLMGNQRVLRARLSDAQFFYQQDLKHPLDAWLEQEKTVVFQVKLGTLYEKSQRISQLAKHIAQQMGCDATQAARAGLLCKADLMSGMVGEFPELQGIMGSYYAKAHHELDAVANAMRQHYLPKFAGDALPTETVSQAVALADRLDTLVGILGIGLKPTGEKDPFGLRRAALGVLRILIEGRLALDLKELITTAAAQYSNLSNQNVVTETFDYVMDRLKNWYADQGIAGDVFLAVMAKVPSSPLDFDQRIHAVNLFRQLPEAQALAAANKRVSRLLGKEVNGHALPIIQSNLLESEAEKTLATLLAEKQKEMLPLYQQANYQQALTQLASLREPVDRFFDEVMVMVDDEALKNNRLAILSQLHQLFLHVADISLLQ